MTTVEVALGERDALLSLTSAIVDDKEVIAGATDESKEEDADDDREASGLYANQKVNRGDEEILEGATIGENQEEEAFSSSDEEGDVIIHVTKTAPRRNNNISKLLERGQRSYVRPQLRDSKQDGEEEERQRILKEFKELRFPTNRTAFDIDLDALETQPWRKKNSNISDYFNYGFDEESWMIYVDKQLRIRASKGAGPYTETANRLKEAAKKKDNPNPSNAEESNIHAPRMQSQPPQPTDGVTNRFPQQPYFPPGGRPSNGPATTFSPYPMGNFPPHMFPGGFPNQAYGSFDPRAVPPPNAWIPAIESKSGEREDNKQERDRRSRDDSREKMKSEREPDADFGRDRDLTRSKGKASEPERSTKDDPKDDRRREKEKDRHRDSSRDRDYRKRDRDDSRDGGRRRERSRSRSRSRDKRRKR